MYWHQHSVCILHVTLLKCCFCFIWLTWCLVLLLLTFILLHFACRPLKPFSSFISIVKKMFSKILFTVFLAFVYKIWFNLIYVESNFSTSYIFFVHNNSNTSKNDNKKRLLFFFFWLDSTRVELKILLNNSSRYNFRNEYVIIFFLNIKHFYLL